MAAQEAQTPDNELDRCDEFEGAEAARMASECGIAELSQFIYARDPRVLLALLTNPNFGEREALLLLNRRDLIASVIQELASHSTLVNCYAVKRALAKHPKTPLRIALDQLKFLFLFDLVSVCLQPSVAAEVKRASEELILAQIPKLAVGQRITLAKRGSARLAANLLKGENSQIIQAVLDNPYLTESVLLPVLNRADCSPKIVEAISAHRKWGLRYDVQLALLRKSSLPVPRALAILPDLKPQDAQEISQDPCVNPQIRGYLSDKAKEV